MDLWWGTEVPRRDTEVCQRALRSDNEAWGGTEVIRRGKAEDPRHGSTEDPLEEDVEDPLEEIISFRCDEPRKEVKFAG